MKVQLIQLFLLVLASAIVMILHELPKSIIYTKSYNMRDNVNKKNLFALYQYIDPIGLIFCITNYTGFSKPYVYRVSSKKTNRSLAVTGYLSLILTFLSSTGLLKFMYVRFGVPKEVSLLKQSIYLFFLYIAIVSMGMLLVNLFPVSTFDMGLLIASISSDKYYSIIRYDNFTKLILCLLVALGVVSDIALFIVNVFINVTFI